MEIMKGYKQTEIGVIPNDWEIKKIGDVAELFGRIGFRGYTVNDIVKEGYGAITISPSNMQGEKMNFKKCTYISWFKYEESPEIKIYNGDILLVKTGSTFGKSALVENLNEKATINPQIVVFKKLKINNILFSKIISNPIVQEQINASIVGGAIPTLSQRLVLNFKIPLPPTLQEQNAIANALSDTDTWINSLEQLLNKKRQIKQGAMQELLQPKDGWEVKKLGEIGKPYGGLSGKAKDDFYKGGFPYIPFMNIMTNPIIDTNYVDYVNIKQGEIQNKAQKFDLFFNGSSETPEEVGMCSVLLEDVPNLYLNSFCFGYRLFKEHNINALYLSYFFRSDEGRNLFYSMAQGATRYNLSKGNFLKLEIKLPKPEEQTRIATILSDMDEEIAQLEIKLAKAKQIKQGMMQELLTGRIRLVK